MVYVQSKNNNGTEATIYCVMYENDAELKSDGVLDTDQGEITCHPGSLAWKAGFTDLKHYSGAAWVDA